MVIGAITVAAMLGMRFALHTVSVFFLFFFSPAGDGRYSIGHSFQKEAVKMPQLELFPDDVSSCQSVQGKYWHTATLSSPPRSALPFSSPPEDRAGAGWRVGIETVPRCTLRTCHPFHDACQLHVSALGESSPYYPPSPAAVFLQASDLEATVSGYTLAVWPHGAVGFLGLMGAIWLIA